MVTEILETFGLVELVSGLAILLCMRYLLYDSSPPVREFHARFERAWHRFDFTSCKSAESLGSRRSLSAVLSGAGKVCANEPITATPRANLISEFV
jgi:hypothetical protein